MTDSGDKIKKRYNRIASLYDAMEYMMEKGKMGDWREALWKRVNAFLSEDSGEGNHRLLEAGVGTGKNIAYYPEDIDISAIDFSEKMLAKARKKAEECNRDIDLLKMNIEDLRFPDNHFDLIVTSCVFCSVPNPVNGFRELKRVCKDNGRIIMLEHMRTRREPWGKLMDAFNWISLYTWGANINRETMKNIRKADLKVVEEKDLWFDIVKELVLKP